MRTLFCGVLLVVAAIPAMAVNVSGKWALQAAGGRAGGRGGATILTLTQVGAEVTGTISVRVDAGSNSPVNDEIWGGKLEGDTLSFYVWTGTDQPAKTTYVGTLSASGDEITFTVTGGRGEAGGVGMGLPPGAGGAQAGRGGQNASGPTAGGAPVAGGPPSGGTPAGAAAGRGQAGPPQITAKRTK